MNIQVNSFCKRQIKGSEFSYFTGSWERLCEIVNSVFDNNRPADGHETDQQVLLVTLPNELVNQFVTGIVEVTTDTILTAKFAPRRAGEQAFVQVQACNALCLNAKHVEIVLYANAALGADATFQDSTWEIVSINARSTVEPEPLTPMAMARNFLEMAGGTRAEYTAAQFAESIVYWSTRVNVL